MKPLLVILICMGIALAVFALTDVRLPIEVHTVSVRSDGTSGGTRVTSTKNEKILFPLKWVAQVGLALDVFLVLLVAILIRRRV